MLNFLNPKIGQVSWEVTEWQEIVAELMGLFPAADRSSVEAQLGPYILQEGPFGNEENVDDMETCWLQKAIVAPKLAKLVLRLLAIAPTEAACSLLLSPSHSPKGFFLTLGGG